MIEYDNSNQFKILCQLSGSVIPGSLWIGVFTGSVGLCLAILRETGITEDLNQGDDSYIEKSFSVQVLATVVGYLLVVRTNMALARWMDGISDVQMMLSKWGDAYNTLISFFSGKPGAPEVQKRILMFRVRIAHWFSLMSCLAFATLRGGFLTSLDDVPIKEMFSPDVAEFRQAKSFAVNKNIQNGGSEEALVDLEHRASQPSRGSEMGDIDGIRELDLYVLHRPTAEEVIRLEQTTDKVNTICVWIIQGIMLEIRSKTLDTPPPIVTRVLQELSNGMLGFSQAHKVAMVPFPFPFAQMVSILLWFLYLVFPFFVDTFTQNPVITPLISFFVPLCYSGLNSLAIELEAPFGSDCNDVDIEQRHEEFLRAIVDTLRQPMLPPIGTETGRPPPEKTIARSISRVVAGVHERTHGCWHWDLLELDEQYLENRASEKPDHLDLGRKRSGLEAAEANKPPLPPATLPPGPPVTQKPGAKEATDISEWAEESNLEEVGKEENGYLGSRMGLLCGAQCQPGCENTNGSMPMLTGDLGTGHP